MSNGKVIHLKKRMQHIFYKKYLQSLPKKVKKKERNYALLSSTKSAISLSTCLDEESSNISSTSFALSTDSNAKLRAYSIAPQFVKISIASSISS